MTNERLLPNKTSWRPSRNDTQARPLASKCVCTEARTSLNFILARKIGRPQDSSTVPRKQDTQRTTHGLAQRQGSDDLTQSAASAKQIRQQKERKSGSELLCTCMLPSSSKFSAHLSQSTGTDLVSIVSSFREKTDSQLLPGIQGPLHP